MNYRIDLGCGRVKKEGFIGIDSVQIIDGNNNPTVDIVRDVEKHGLPFCDNSAIEIIATSVLEHIGDLTFVMNECWRVLKPRGTLWGSVPLAGTDGAWRDPTHKRFFTESTFDYFCGKSLANPKNPGHPKYADYGFKPWIKIKVERPNNNGSIYFKLRPRKDEA